MNTRTTAVCLGILLVSAFAGTALVTHQYRRPDPPRSVEEASARMRDIGLNVVQDLHTSTGSVHALTKDEVTELRFGSRQEEWVGCVRVWIGGNYLGICERPDLKTVSWGAVVLSGDPALVDKMVGR